MAPKRPRGRPPKTTAEKKLELIVWRRRARTMGRRPPKVGPDGFLQSWTLSRLNKAWLAWLDSL